MGRRTLQSGRVYEPGLPVGAILPYGLDVEPAGWLLCYGQAVSRSTYARLFDVVGTAFGSGDGSTTFNLPDCRGRVFLGKDNLGGSSANRVTASEADNIGQGSGAETHTLSVGEGGAHSHPENVAATTGNVGSAGADGITSGHDGDAGQTTATGGGGSHNNMQPYQTKALIIKY